LLGLGASSAPVMGCAQCLALCDDNLRVVLQATPQLNTQSAELQVTVGTESMSAHVDYVNATCTMLSGTGFSCGVLNGDVYLDFALTDGRDSTRLYLTLTSAEGVLIAHYNDHVDTPAVTGCGQTCHEGNQTIVTGPRT
jgi:hypothetical protein